MDRDDIVSELGMAPSVENSGTSTATFGNNSPEQYAYAAALPTAEAHSSPGEKHSDFEIDSSGNEDWQRVPDRPIFLPPVGTDSSQRSWVPLALPEFPRQGKSSRLLKVSPSVSTSPRTPSNRSI